MVEVEHELIWLAGLLEGEGWFGTGYNRKKPYPKIMVRMTDKDVIEHAARLFGTATTACSPTTSGKVIWCTTVAGVKAEWLMQKLYPWLGERRRAKIDATLSDYRASLTYDKQVRPWPIDDTGQILFGQIA